MCTVFAQLTVNGKWEGPHVFVVRIRDNNSQLTPGVRILDNGPKMGLNGVDNGQIWFDHVQVPRDALLDRYASVSADGEYSSSIKSVAQRFGVTVGGLTTGENNVHHVTSIASNNGMYRCLLTRDAQAAFGALHDRSAPGSADRLYSG